MLNIPIDNINVPKSLWKFVKQKIGNAKVKDTSIECLNADGVQVTGPAHIAEHLNNFFCTVGANLAKNIHDSDPNYVPRTRLLDHIIFLEPVLESEGR